MLFLLSSVQAATLTADMVDFSDAYVDMASVFGTIAVLLMILLSYRSVSKFLR